VEELLAQGCHYVVDADLKSYFDTIPHDRLMDRVRSRVADGSVLSLVEQFLKQSVLEELEHWTPTEGTPQGAVISPLLSNLYLDPLDHHMAQQGFEMIRYADDFVVLCRTPQEAQKALAAVQAWMEAAGLRLHPEKTRVVDAKVEGFDFLGYRFEGNSRRPSRKSGQKLSDSVRALTPRTQGWSLPKIVYELNQRLRGWGRYFCRSSYGRLAMYDGWIRMRLRHILKRRAGGRGMAKGMDLARWPNTYFAQLGLISLDQFHKLLRRSACR
jgi:RNA-directed DNA polymerase